MTSNFQQSTCTDDEIDLKELILVLWHRKLFIILCTLAAIVASSIYVNIKPNIYEAKAVFKINAAPYGVSGRSTGDAFEYLSSIETQNKIASIAGQEALNLTMKISGASIIATKQGTDAQVIFNEVSIYEKYINRVYIQEEVSQIKAQLVPVKKLLEKQKIPEVKQLIAENYSYLIYKEALLESGSIELVKVTTSAIKPVNSIKPKRALIVTLATLLAAMLSIFIVLILHSFIPDKLNK